MRKKILIPGLFICMLSSCGLVIHMVSTANSQDRTEMDTEGKQDVPSPYNDNNILFKTNRTFCYQVEQIEKGRHLFFGLDMMVIPGSFNLNQSKVKYKYHYNPLDLDSNELKQFGYDGKGGFEPEFTSLIEEKNELNFHPPRSKTLTCLEAAPFPEIPFRIKKGTHSKSFLFIPRGSWGKLGGSKITWHYEIDSVAYVSDTIPYFCSVYATADSRKGGHNTLRIYFNKDSGFTKLYYHFQDSTIVNFTLTEIE